jgi:hypothetical protein
MWFGDSLGSFVEDPMFGLLTRSPRSRKLLVRRSTMLCLESLEDRLTPSGSPETITLNVTHLSGSLATCSGNLQNQNGPVANQVINLTGAVQASTRTDSQGNYSVTLQAPQVGQEDTTSADGLSNVAQCNLQGGSLTINSFSATYLGNGYWLFSGTVSGANSQGAVVNFSGISALQGQSTTVNADGTFNFYSSVPPDQTGMVYAQVVDSSGDTSLMVETEVTQTP